MQSRCNVNLFISIALAIFGFHICTAYAENVENIIDTQKELKASAHEKEKAHQTQMSTIEKTKNAIAMGKNEYQRTCSLCHGIDAKGHGVYAFELKTAPADLTLIKSRNNGVFSFSDLYQVIDGRQSVKSHGTRDMPVWGDRYNSESWLATNQRNSETFVRGQIFELLLYLETIQK